MRLTVIAHFPFCFDHDSKQIQLYHMMIVFQKIWCFKNKFGFLFFYFINLITSRWQRKINRWWVWFTDSQVLEYSLTFLDKRQHLYGLIAEYETVMKKKTLYSSLWMYSKLDCSSLTDSSKVLLTVPGVFFENCSWPLHRVLFITEPFVEHHGECQK